MTDSLSATETALAEDASGRPFAELLTVAADLLDNYGGGPVVDCLRLKAFEVSEALASRDTSPPEGREGIVTVYSSVTGAYLGCMGAETWARLLMESTARPPVVVNEQKEDVA